MFNNVGTVKFEITQRKMDRIRNEKVRRRFEVKDVVDHILGIKIILEWSIRIAKESQKKSFYKTVRWCQRQPLWQIAQSRKSWIHFEVIYVQKRTSHSIKRNLQVNTKLNEISNTDLTQL